MMYASAEAGQDVLDRFLDGVRHLPTNPTLMVRLIELFCEPDRDSDALVGLIREEPMLTAAVLQRCNSSRCGAEAVTDVRQAVFRVGFHEVYSLSLALLGRQTWHNAKAAWRIPVESLWQHAITTAIVAGTLARELGESEGIAFTAGLLHDIGKVALANADAERYAELLAEHGPCGPHLLAAEKYEFGFQHTEIGARLLHRWGVPEQVWQPVLCHHETEWTGRFKRLSAVVTLANLMAHDIETSASATAGDPVATAHALAMLELNLEDLQRLAPLARTEVKRSLPCFVSH